MSSGPDERLVALGASNLTRGLGTILRATPGIPIYGALGHGRSYGVESRFWTRTLPGIARCGIWSALRPGPRTRALVTDIGNDVVYGIGVPEIMAWVTFCIDRLGELGATTVVTDLPLASLERLSNPAFLAIRSFLVPQSRMPLPTVRERAHALNEGVLALAAARGLQVVHLRPEWYRGDPIHIRPRFWKAAWREILGRPVEATRQANGIRAYWARAEKQEFLGRDVGQTQPVITFRDGGSLFLY